MSISKELNARLFENAEEQRIHVEYRSEYGYYGAVADGDIEAVKKFLSDPITWIFAKTENTARSPRTGCGVP